MSLYGSLQESKETISLYGHTTWELQLRAVSALLLPILIRWNLLLFILSGCSVTERCREKQAIISLYFDPALRHTIPKSLTCLSFEKTHFEFSILNLVLSRKYLNVNVCYLICT